MSLPFWKLPLKESVMINKIIIFLLLICQTTFSEEIKRTKVVNPNVPDAVKTLLSKYWRAAQEGNQEAMKLYSEAVSQFKIDISIAQSVQGKSIKTKPTYFEKVVYRKDPSKVSYLVSMDIYSSGDLVKESHGCQVLKERNQKFFIVGYIGDCLD